MYQELQRIKVDLELRKPFSPQVTHQLKELDTLDYICNAMILDGVPLSRKTISGMMDGDMPREATLENCMFVRTHMGLMDLINTNLEMKSSLDTKLLLKFHNELTGEARGFRTSNFTMTEYKYVPPHSSEVEAKINQLLRTVYRAGGNEIKNASLIHCGILAINPFEEYSGIIARLAMNYYLQEKGFLPVALGYSYEEYTSTMTECFRDDNDAVFYWGLERAQYNKMTQVLQIVEAADGE